MTEPLTREQLETLLEDERATLARIEPSHGGRSLRLIQTALHYEARSREVEAERDIERDVKLATVASLREVEADVANLLSDINRMEQNGRNLAGELVDAEARVAELEEALAEIGTQSSTYDDAAGKDANEQRKRVAELEAALRANDVDARWIVGQWQRLKDEPVRDVALAIVDRTTAALAAETL